MLKLLQKSYGGKVKMIYIDPPYNTGKDFVYKDNYRDNLRNYKEQTGQVDSDGNTLSTNSDTDGRYHSNWLNMMYPRRPLAKNLLREDGRSLFRSMITRSTTFVVCVNMFSRSKLCCLPYNNSQNGRATLRLLR